MKKVKQQRVLGKGHERFLVSTSVEVGAEIRRIADKKGISSSKLIAHLVEAHLYEVEEEVERTPEETIEEEQPLSLIERRAFMKLPINERRRIMAEQAEKMAQYYERNSEWKELQGGDIVEY